MKQQPNPGGDDSLRGPAKRESLELARGVDSRIQPVVWLRRRIRPQRFRTLNRQLRARDYIQHNQGGHDVRHRSSLNIWPPNGTSWE